MASLFSGEKLPRTQRRVLGASGRWGELVSNGRLLEVPPFQRNYAWQEKDWEDLWSDLLEAQANNSNHYMGSVVLQALSERHFSLIDGQQRLTTLSILAAAVIDRLTRILNSDALRRARQLLVAAYGSPVTGPGLSLSGNNVAGGR